MRERAGGLALLPDFARKRAQSGLPLRVCEPTAHLYMIRIQEDAFMNDFPRITQNPAVMGGKPCIRGLRVTVGLIVGQIGAGRTMDELLADYPYLEREDIHEALRYAAWRAEEREIELSER